MKLINVKGLRFKLIVMFLGCIIISILFSFLVDKLFANNKDSYNSEIYNFTNQCKEIEEEIKKSKGDDETSYIINENIKFADIFILNDNGEALIKNKNCMEKTFDLDSLTNENNTIDVEENAIKYNVVDKLNENTYILFSGILKKGDMNIYIFIITFIFLFFVFTNKEIKYIKELCLGLKEISKGNLMNKVKVVGKDEISEIGKSINYMSQKLYEYREKGKEIEKNKDIFIMSISHDLRTPLTSIIGYVKLLKEQHKYEDDIKKYIDIIDVKSARLDKLINDFFEYNKIVNCEVNLNKVDISLNEFLRQVVTGIMSLCNEKNLKIKLSFPSEDICVCIDPDKMFRVIENLLANAIKYSNKNSEIEVTLSKEESNTIISIANECGEFNKEEIDRIFERFYRGDKSRNTTKGGAGLGLAIAKSIVKLHNGDIFAEYKQNKVCINVLI